MTIADRIIAFNKNLDYKGQLPPGIRIMNPFRESAEAVDISTKFYHRFYNDDESRVFIIGINPGRHGAGITGVPFTDTKRMESHCGIKVGGFHSHELSSVFVYEMIDALGGVERFYSKYYINSGCPLGFVKRNDRGREINYNYYDSPELYRLVRPFMIASIREQIALGLNTEKAFCLGTGKNFKYLSFLNAEFSFFKEIVPLEHPRYIMQYKSKEKIKYIDKYLQVLG